MQQRHPHTGECAERALNGLWRGCGDRHGAPGRKRQERDLGGLVPNGKGIRRRQHLHEIATPVSASGREAIVLGAGVLTEDQGIVS